MAEAKLTDASGVVRFEGTVSGELDASQVGADGASVQIGGASSSVKLGDSGSSIAFFGKNPAAWPAAIPNPAGGATVDAEARDAIAAINAVLQTLGLTND